MDQKTTETREERSIFVCSRNCGFEQVAVNEEQETVLSQIKVCPYPGCDGEVVKMETQRLNIPAGRKMLIVFGESSSGVRFGDKAQPIIVETGQLLDMAIGDLIYLVTNLEVEDDGSEPDRPELPMGVEGGESGG